MAEGPKHKTRHTKSYTQESGNSLECIGTEDNFPNKTSMAQVQRSTIHKWDLMKLQSFCKAKDTVNRTKCQPTDWERIFTNLPSDRGLISKIYKELKKLNTNNPNNPIFKMVQRVEQKILNRGISNGWEALKEMLSP